MVAAFVLFSNPAAAQGAKLLTKCAPDAVVSGTVCMDRFEAGVWRVPDPAGANKRLVKKIRQGKATVVDLAKGGAAQLGIAGDNYAPCADSGQNCSNDIFALSLPEVTPSANLTWFQAQVACKNSAKRLPSNAEWQAAVIGTPDPGPDNGTTDCHTDSISSSPTPTGSRSGCVSLDGAFDMVGNLLEWTADWAPNPTDGCVPWSAAVSPTGDSQCMQGAATATPHTNALARGGGFGISSFSAAGPLTVRPRELEESEFFTGFRCAR